MEFIICCSVLRRIPFPFEKQKLSVVIRIENWVKKRRWMLRVKYFIVLVSGTWIIQDVKMNIVYQLAQKSTCKINFRNGYFRPNSKLFLIPSVEIGFSVRILSLINYVLCFSLDLYYIYFYILYIYVIIYIFVIFSGNWRTQMKFPLFF